MPSLLLLAVALQSAQPVPSRNTDVPVPVASAARAERPPVINGRDDDAVWQTAVPITGFREFQPREDGDPRFRTEARVAYDGRNLYVFVRAYDPHPDSILQLLARRDQFTPSDKIWVLIDSYHDRRTGYEFGVNPAGVKIDMYTSNDGNENDAWDAVWDVATTVDSLGWTAEYRIPLSQLRYVPSESNTFGFAIFRDLQRTTERFSWPVFRRSRSGFASQWGNLEGLVGLESPRRLEATPYVVTQNVQTRSAGAYGRGQRLALGADVKYGITSNLTLDGTVNPDFGQVEADPSVLNLGAFETFFQERRPFFIEGTGVFSFGVNCSAVNCNGENLFYSRRIGRQPQVGRYADEDSPTTSRILGAAKLTGRLGNGLTVGMLEAVTQRAAGRGDTTIEPMTSYAAFRLQQDLRGGESGIGAMVTAVNRNLDDVTRPVLRGSAYAGAIDLRHRFLNRRYQVSASFDFSRVAGSRQAIAATQRSSTHNFQRPDDNIAYDTTLTELTGNAQEIKFGKFGGGWTRFETAYMRRSPGFEINDVGFLRRADQQSWATWAALQGNTPTAIYQRGFWNFNWWQFWTNSGLPTERAFNTNFHVQLKNRMWVHAGGTIGQLGEVYCDIQCTRGGPALRVDRYVSPWMGIEGDDRKVIRPSVWFNYQTGDAGRLRYVNVNPQARMRLSSRFNANVGVNLSRNRNDRQPFGTRVERDTAGAVIATHYTFAHLEQREGSVSLRLDYTASPTLSLQVYAQPFVSKGTYSSVRELANPRAATYDARFQPYTDSALTANGPGGFNFKQFRSNVVVRWEYRPGSTLFLVWTQGREASQSIEGSRPLTGEFGDLLGARPNNTFLVKASYWLSW